MSNKQWNQQSWLALEKQYKKIVDGRNNVYRQENNLAHEFVVLYYDAILNLFEGGVNLIYSKRRWALQPILTRMAKYYADLNKLIEDETYLQILENNMKSLDELALILKDTQKIVIDSSTVALSVIKRYAQEDHTEAKHSILVITNYLINASDRFHRFFKSSFMHEMKQMQQLFFTREWLR